MTLDNEGLRAKDIERCFACGEGVAKAGPVLYRVKLQQYVLNKQAIEQTAGLEMMLHGNVALARAIGPDPEIANATAPECSGLLCSKCATSPGYMLLLELLEVGE